MKNYSIIPTKKLIINKTGDDVRFCLKSFNDESFFIKNNESISIEVKTSEILALLYRKCQELGLLIEDEDKIELSFIAEREENSFIKGKPGTVKYDKLGTINVLSNNDYIITTTTKAKNGNELFTIQKIDNKDTLFLEDNLDEGIYNCTIQAKDKKGNISNKVEYKIQVIEDNSSIRAELEISYNNQQINDYGTNGGDIIGTLTVNCDNPYTYEIKAPSYEWYSNQWVNSVFFKLEPKLDNEDNEIPNTYNLKVIRNFYSAASPIFPLKIYLTDSVTNDTICIGTRILAIE